MDRRNRTPRGVLSGHRRLMESHDDDPLTSVANLFDVAMVFAVAILMALVSHYSLPDLLSGQGEITILKNPGKANMEVIRHKGVKLEHYRMTTQTLGGEGVKLGTAYRLQTGEVVYVPEAAASARKMVGSVGRTNRSFGSRKIRHTYSPSGSLHSVFSPNAIIHEAKTAGDGVGSRTATVGRGERGLPPP